MRNTGYAVATALMTSAAATLSRPAPPPGWRYPTLPEVAQQWRDQVPGRSQWISADFDGDGVTDSAMLLLRTPTPVVGLVVVLGRSPGKAITLEVPGDAAWLNVMGIKIVPAGQYKTACGKGYVECTQDEPGVLALQHPAIDFFMHSTNFYFYFDRQKGSFRRVWISH